MVFTMACPNFKKGMKMAFGPLGVKTTIIGKDIQQNYLDHIQNSLANL
jgi:hypothetical protein